MTWKPETFGKCWSLRSWSDDVYLSKEYLFKFFWNICQKIRKGTFLFGENRFSGEKKFEAVSSKNLFSSEIGFCRNLEEPKKFFSEKKMKIFWVVFLKAKKTIPLK